MGNWGAPLIEIGSLKVRMFQGGMGVGISMANLASAVANEGGMGVIASVGLNEFKGHSGEYIESSKRALKDEIRLARRKTSGAIGVNIMYVLSNFPDLVRTALKENVEAIISGAGLPLDLPGYLGDNKKTKLIPIVSSARAMEIIIKTWKRRYDYVPDAIIVEGPKAGGHLGYSIEKLADPEFVEHGLEKILVEVVEAVKPYETDRKIPVIAAGGIFYGGDIKKFLNLGASGVQMATRFVTTNECDASMEFKQAYLDSKKEDIIIIQSPVGMPGRAIKNKFLEEVEAGERKPINCPYHCLKPCKPEKSPYCIAQALINAKNGKFNDGYVFCGSNAYLCNEIIPVKKVFKKLNQEYISS